MAEGAGGDSQQAHAQDRMNEAGGFVYHVLNRANRRATLFHEEGDYEALLRVIALAQVEHPMPL